MCKECLQTPCHPRCPNADGPEVFGECDGCGNEIYDGDEYYEIDGKIYCEDCIIDFRKTAEVEIDYDRERW